MAEGIQNKTQIVTDKPVLQMNIITTLKGWGRRANANNFRMQYFD